MSLSLQIEWTRQPPLGTAPKRLKGLRGVLVPNGASFVDVNRATGLIVPGTTSRLVTSVGYAVGSANANTVAVPGLNNSQVFSRLCVFRREDLGANAGISDTRNDTSGGAGWYITAAGALTLDKSFAVAIVGSGNILTVAKYYVLGVTYDGVTGRLFVDGVNVTSTATAAPNFSIPGTGYLYRGSSNTSSTVNSGIALHADWNYALSIAAMQRYTANPWQIFEPDAVIIFDGAAVAGGASNAPRYFHRTQAGMS